MLRGMRNPTAKSAPERNRNSIRLCSGMECRRGRINKVMALPTMVTVAERVMNSVLKQTQTTLGMSAATAVGRSSSSSDHIEDELFMFIASQHQRLDQTLYTPQFNMPKTVNLGDTLQSWLPPTLNLRKAPDRSIVAII